MSKRELLKLARELESAYQKYSDEWYAALYLEFGSIEQILDTLSDLPISVAEYYRAIDRVGIVKGEGRTSTSLAQTLYIFWQRALEPNLTFKQIYLSIPLSTRASRTFPSLNTIYRIYDSVKKRKTTRLGVGVVISKDWNNTSVLVADEKFGSNLHGRVSGNTTIPFGFVCKKLPFEKSVLRILQREFSTELALQGRLVLDAQRSLNSFSRNLIPENIRPFMEIDVLDIKVQIAHIRLPMELCDLSHASSFAVDNHRFDGVDNLLSNNNLRPGMEEVLLGYSKYLFEKDYVPIYTESQLNRSLIV